MKKQHLASKRRALLKSTAAAGGLLVFGKAAPESWIRPVVNATVLPAHAQTTQASDNSPIDTPQDAPADVNPCSGESAMIQGRDQFALDLIYDGTSAPTFVIRDIANAGDVHNDTILAVNTAPTIAVGPGYNWETGVPRLERNVADGLYTRTTERLIDRQPTGDIFEITFCIATVGAGDSTAMTLTLVSIRKI